MRELLEGVLPALGARLLEKDIREDPALERRYFLEIPVLLHGDREIARYRITAAEVRERLRAAGFPFPERSTP
jgi:glutaredoxin-like protein DUF836